MTDKKNDPNYGIVRGLVPQPLVKRFKFYCIENNVDNSEGLEKILAEFFQTDVERDSAEENITISMLIELWGNPNDLAEKSRIKLQKIEKYRSGDRPTDTDLVKLGGLLKKADGTILKTADLQQIRDRTFPVNRMPTNGNV